MTVPYTLYANTSDDPTWREWANAAPPPGGGGDPGGGGSTLPYFGYALDTNADFTSMCNSVGQMLVRRTYNTPTTGVPTSFSTSSAKNDASLGASISYLSIRPDINDTASGALDSKLAAFAASCPAGTIVSWWPEGEGNRFGFSATTWKQGLKRSYQAMKNANPNLLIGPCWMTYSFTPGTHGYPLDNWFIPPLSATADFVAWDGYNDFTGSQWQSFQQVMAPGVQWVRDRSDLPIYVAEAGTIADPAITSRRGQWWTDAWTYAASVPMPIVCGWQGDAKPQYDVFPNDAPALNAIAGVNNLAKVGR